MAGEIEETKRNRYESNERFDVVDAQDEGFLSIVRDAMAVKAYSGGLLPFVAGYGETIGTVLQSGAVTSPGANQIQLGSPLFVAIDSDGLILIKPTGSITVSVPSNQSTLYAYGLDEATDDGLRQFVAATSPYAESPRSIKTRYTGKVGLVAIAGNATVNSYTINGIERSLCAIALLNNTAGTVTVTQLFSNMLHAVRPLALQKTQNGAYNILGNSISPGGTSYTYVVVASGRGGEVLKVSNPLTILTGNAILGLATANQLTIPSLPEASQYTIYRTASAGTPSSTGVVGVVDLPPGFTGSFFFNDDGIAASAAAVPLSTIDPVVVPSSDTDHGSTGQTAVTIEDQVRLVSTMLADVKFKGSLPTFNNSGTQPNKQARTNNFGAYDTIRRGLDMVDRGTTQVWTIGDGVTSFGDFDISNFNGLNELLDELGALISQTPNYISSPAAPAHLNSKWTIVLKNGTYQLQDDCAVPENIRLIGEQPQYVAPTLAATSLSLDVIGARINLNGYTLRLRDGAEMSRVTISQTGTDSDGGLVSMQDHTRVRDCTFLSIYGLGIDPDLGAVVQSTFGARDVIVERCTFRCFNNGGAPLAMYTTGILLSGAYQCTVRDCVFATTTGRSTYNTAQRPMPSTGIELAVIKECLVENCKFYMGDDPFMNAPSAYGGFPGNSGSTWSQAAIRVMGVLPAESATLVQVRGCEFGLVNVDTGGVVGTTIPYINGGSGYNYFGVYVENEANVNVEDSYFQYLTAGVVMSYTSTAANLASRVSDNEFINMGLAGVFVYSPSGAPTITEMQVNDNIFRNVQVGVLFNAPPGASITSMTFRNIEIMRNEFTDLLGSSGAAGTTTTPVSTAIILNALLVERLRIEQNRFVNINTGAIALLGTGGSEWNDISISRNMGVQIMQTGYRAQNVALTIMAAILVDLAQPIQNFVCQENQFDVFDSLANSAGVTPYWLYANFVGGARSVLVSKNIITRAGVSRDSSQTRSYFFRLALSHTGTVTTRNIVVNDNMTGDSESQYSLVSMQSSGTNTNGRWYIIEVRGNKHSENVSPGVSLRNHTVIVGQNGVTTFLISNINIADNDVTLTTVSAIANYAFFLFLVQCGDALIARLVNNAVFIDNASTFDVAASGASLARANANAANVNTFKVAGNTAHNGNTSATTFTYIGGFASGTAIYFAGNQQV